MPERELHQYLAELPKRDFANEATFRSEALPTFFEILGYPPSEIFYDVQYKEVETLPISMELEGVRPRVTIRSVDYVVAADRVSQPWLLLEVMRTDVSSPHLFITAANQLRAFQVRSGAPYAVQLSPGLLLIFSDSDEATAHILSIITLSEAAEIYTILKYPGALPTSHRSEELQPPKSIKFDTFSIDPVEYSDLWREVTAADTESSKGKSLEDLAVLVFHGMPFLEVKYRNLRTVSSEIDLVIQNCGWTTMTLFDEFGRYSLVECKNWQAPVGAKEVRDFKGKMTKTQTKLGFLLARNGITGAHGGADALREIHSAFDTEGIYIIVLAEDDFEAIMEGANFYEVLDDKIDRLRFDI